MCKEPCGPCEEKKRPGFLPGKVRRVALDDTLLLALVSGESVIVEHVALPPDAKIVHKRENGVDVELFIASETYELRSCCVGKIPLKRVNYTTGG